MKTNRFRFRVWCDCHKGWEKHDSILLPDGRLVHGDCTLFNERDHHIMFSTGLTDKNGKEIFEGDAVDIGYMDDMQVCWNDELARFELIPLKHKEYSLDLLLRDYDIEVIGNIYENPELLEG